MSPFVLIYGLDLQTFGVVTARCSNESTRRGCCGLVCGKKSLLTTGYTLTQFKGAVSPIYLEELIYGTTHHILLGGWLHGVIDSVIPLLDAVFPIVE